MKKLLLFLVVMLIFTQLSFAQYVTSNTEEGSYQKEYNAARTTFNTGIVVASVGAAAWLGGNVVCMIELNKYTNSHSTVGTAEEIVQLNKEAKQQKGYKVGEAFEIGGYMTMVAGGVTALIAHKKMKKLKNAAGQTVATLEYGATGSGASLTLNF